MESAIPHDLVRPRTIARRVDETYQPPYPAWVARFADSVKGVVMAYFGVQSDTRVPASALDPILERFVASDGPRHVDRARYTDAAGYDTRIVIAYWDDPSAFEGWFTTFRTWWDAPTLGSDGLGYFIELVRPKLERFETLFSTLGKPEGVAVLAAGMSEPINEHAYWGSARERLPLAQVDGLHAEEPRRNGASQNAGVRRRIAPHGNLCLIRSGQDWGETTGDERTIYLRDVEPALREGMLYLRDSGFEIGCHDCRYVDVVDDAWAPSERTFGLAYFHELGDMERWAESHPTHVNIFGRFMVAVQRLEFNLKLRLYHEVTVAAPEEQFFEYVNCHNATGLLKQRERPRP